MVRLAVQTNFNKKDFQSFVFNARPKPTCLPLMDQVSLKSVSPE